ncbi:MAG: integrase [Pseudorhodobacter sp.]|jgi:integrase
MRFNEDLLDGSDPSYAPFVQKIKRWFYWRATKKYTKEGYFTDPIRLVGEEGDGRDNERASKARELTREMLRWYNKEDALVKPGSWLWLIGKFKTDEFSPYNENVKASTRQSYLQTLKPLEVAIGGVMLADTNFETLMRWKKAMTDKFISRRKEENASRAESGLPPKPLDATHQIHNRFTALRYLTSHGVRIEAPDAMRIKNILAQMRITTPRRREIAMTRDQAQAVIAAADEAGNTGFALGFSCQWEFGLRAVDVRGQWLDYGGKQRWADGMTWDMINQGITTLSKTPSKTEKSSPDAMVFDLTIVPEIRARLMQIPMDQRVGPVIKMDAGRPYTKRHWQTTFRKFARKAGVPDEVYAMDSRAGAVTEAKAAGATAEQRQRFANHASATMTARYDRSDKNADVNTVIELRRTKTQLG